LGWRQGSRRWGCPWPLAALRRPSRRTAIPDTAHRPPRHWHPEIDVVGEPMLGVAATLGAGARGRQRGVGTHRS
jgi:hypothetical protein